MAVAAPAWGDMASVPLSSDGVYREFSTSSGTTHYRLLTSNCNSSSYTYSTATGAQDSYRVALTLIPLAATITAIEVTPCASSFNGASAQAQTFVVLNGVAGPYSASYELPPGSPATLAASAFNGLSLVRVSATKIEAGVKLAGGTGGVKLSGLTIRITYTAPEPFIAPTNFSASSPSASEVSLSWIDNTASETGFRVERSLNGTSSWTLVRITAANTTTYKDTSLAPDQTYYYRVQAVNSATGQASPFTSAVSAITYASAPATPRNLWIQPAGADLTLNWTRLSNNDDGTAIEFSADSVSFTQIARTVPGASSYTYTAPSGPVYYRVRAVNRIGNSGYSNVASNVIATTNGPDLRVAVLAQQLTSGRDQTARFTVDYANAGTFRSDNVMLAAAVPVNATFDAALSSPDWQCHNPAADMFKLQTNIGRVLRALKVRYPNLQQVFISSQMYSGYASPPAAILEPYGYEGGFAAKAAIEAQILQARNGTISAMTGDLNYQAGMVPWAAWGPYMWANGMTPNGQGLYFELADFGSDLSHPSDPVGRNKLASVLLNYLLSAPYTSWIRLQDTAPTPILPVSPPMLSLTALLDMLPGQRYLGLPGGLYPEGNALPGDHLAAGIAAGARIQPLDAAGLPSAAGKVVFMSIGYSNTKQMFENFISMATPDLRVKPINDNRTGTSSLRMFNAAVGGGVAASWSDPALSNYEVTKSSLTKLGLYESQVQAVWFNAANPATPLNAFTLTGTAGGTQCVLPLGSLASNAAGSTSFVVRSAFTTSQPVAFSVTAFDDGMAGPDLVPTDNTSGVTFNVSP